MSKKILAGAAQAKNSPAAVSIRISIKQYASGPLTSVSKDRSSEAEKFGREAMRRDIQRQKDLQPA